MKVFCLFFLTISLQIYHISSSKNETNGSEKVIEEVSNAAQEEKPVEHVKVVEKPAADLGGNNTKSDEYVQVVKKITDDLNNMKNQSEINKRNKRQLIGVHIFEHPKEVKRGRGDRGRHEGEYGHNPQKRDGGYGPVVHHGGGYGHDDHHDGGYSSPHGVGYGHNDQHDRGYGHESHGYDHGGYKEPPKKIKPAPYYGPQYSPYDLVAPDKSKKGKVKYGDDPVSESKKGHFYKNSYDKPFKHFGGFGGGGSIGYNAGSLKGHKGGGYGGYGGGGGGHKGHVEGYGGGHKGHDEGYGGGYKGHGGGYGKGHGGGYGKGPKKGHGKGHGIGHGKGHGGGYGHLHKSEPLIGGYSAEEVYQHHGGVYTDNGQGSVYTNIGHGNVYTDSNHGVYAQGLKVFEGDVSNVKHVDYLPVPIYTPLSSPYNTYDAHANLRTNEEKSSNADVSHMLLSDPYTSLKAKIESRKKKNGSKT